MNREPDILYDLHNHSADLKSREIFLHNSYSSDENENPGVEYKMSNNFLKNLRALDLQNHNDITVHMQSIGGEWADGMAIFDAIKMCRSRITIISYGQAESMSSIMLQAAAKRLITPNSYFMCHFGSTESGGHYLDVQNWVRYEKHICNIMIDIYASRCIKGKYFKEKYGSDVSIEKVKNFIYRKLKSGDWYMNADDAVYYGFADGVIKKWH
jgi:ATP-dependent protease ClpP protease subunit